MSQVHLSESDKKELEQLAKMASDKNPTGLSWFKKYVSESSSHKCTISHHYFSIQHGYEQILGWYRSLSEHSDLVRYVSSIGTTGEGKDLAAVHITASTNPARHRIYLQCLIHASE